MVEDGEAGKKWRGKSEMKVQSGILWKTVKDGETKSKIEGPNQKLGCKERERWWLQSEI